jgi:hypothetical protein
MPMLGDLLAAARRSATGFEGWIGAVDPDIARDMARAAAAAGLATAGFARAAVADFSRHASEEDWATLISSIRDSEDPGTLCLLLMVRWRLTVPACADHHVHVPAGGIGR